MSGLCVDHVEICLRTLVVPWSRRRLSDPGSGELPIAQRRANRRPGRDATGKIARGMRLYAAPAGMTIEPVSSVVPRGWDGAGVPGGASQGQSPARGAPDAAPQAPP